MFKIAKVFNRRAKGDVYEQVALKYLKQKGLTFVAHNVNFKGGEIDLIMQDQQQLVFIEVRFRANQQFGGALASVNHSKQQKLIHAAQLYLQKQYGNSPPSCRFDVVAIEGETPNEHIQWLKNVIA